MTKLHEYLREQYGPRGIYAGSTHFKALWIRDSLFACFGALALKDYTIVEKNINTILANLREGHVPLRIGYKSQILQQVGLPAGYGVTNNQDKGNYPPFDGNSLLLIIAEKYENSTSKKLDHDKLKQVVSWFDKNEKNSLLYEGPYASWEDSLNLTGPRLYTNVCYYRALIAASKIFKDSSYLIRAAKTKKQILKWWNGKYFTDGHRNTFMAAGNLLAILWGIADSKKSKKILKYMSKRKTICPPACYRPIKTTEVPWYMRLLGLRQYHGTMEWSWLAAAEIACYRLINEPKEAYRRNTLLVGLMEKYGGIYEVYINNLPVKQFFYKSEKNFAWTLGIFIASQSKTLSLLR
jgi:hypothetical protein